MAALLSFVGMSSSISGRARVLFLQSKLPIDGNEVKVEAPESSPQLRSLESNRLEGGERTLVNKHIFDSFVA